MIDRTVKVLCFASALLLVSGDYKECTITKTVTLRKIRTCDSVANVNDYVYELDNYMQGQGVA